MTTSQLASLPQSHQAAFPPAPHTPCPLPTPLPLSPHPCLSPHTQPLDSSQQGPSLGSPVKGPPEVGMGAAFLWTCRVWSWGGTLMVSVSALGPSLGPGAPLPPTQSLCAQGLRPQAVVGREAPPGDAGSVGPGHPLPRGAPMATGNRECEGNAEDCVAVGDGRETAC